MKAIVAVNDQPVIDGFNRIDHLIGLRVGIGIVCGHALSQVLCGIVVKPANPVLGHRFKAAGALPEKAVPPKLGPHR